MTPEQGYAWLDDLAPCAPSSVSTGIFGLDLALSGGGWSLNTTSQIWGVPDSGKTTVLYHALAQAQKLGLTVGFLDFANRFHPEYAARIGIDLDNLFLISSGAWKQALYESSISFVAVDSVSDQFTAQELGGGGSRTMLVATQAGWNYGTATYHQFSYGRHYTPQIENASARVRLQDAAAIGKDGRYLKALVEWDSGSVSISRFASMHLIYDDGIVREADVVSYGLREGVLRRRGAWVYFRDDRIGMGVSGAEDALRNDDTLRWAVEGDICARVRPRASQARH